MTELLERTQLIRRPRKEVFRFFENPKNLERITPAFLKFRIVTPEPIAMVEDARIEYRLALFGLPFGWCTTIESYESPTMFVDRQLRGPYRLWRHTHEFSDFPGGTRMVDRVEYELPFGFLGDLAHAVFVRRTLNRVFDHRERVIAEIFEGRGVEMPPHSETLPASAK